MVLTVLGSVSVLLGALIFATAALSLTRFPDAYTRITAVGTAGGVGIILTVTGALLLQPSAPSALKVVLIVALQLATSAVGSMAIARSAYLTRTPMLRVAYSDLELDPDRDHQDPTPDRR